MRVSKPLLVLIIPAILHILGTTDGANILFYHNLASYSHRVVTYPLAVALAERGHKVTIISPYHPRDPVASANIEEIVPKKVEKSMIEFAGNDFDVSLRVAKLLPRLVFAVFPNAVSICEDLLTSPEFKEFLSKTKTLDLVIMDNCLAECGAAIAYKYKAKHVMFETLPHWPFEHDFFGTAPSSLIPEMEMEPPDFPMTFLERVKNVLVSLHFRYSHYDYMKKLDPVIRKYLDVPQMPFIDDVARNASLIFYTGDIISDYPRPEPPNVVNIAGIHVKTDSKPLPEAIQKFIDGGNDGFVYISLGSLVVPANLPKEVKQVFFDTIESFPNLRFLWTWHGEIPAKIPNNLYISKWFPQTDVLAHPKLKAFLTQGGKPSTIEALYNGVPMIAFPVLADQDYNCKRMNQMGANVLLELGTVTREELKGAIQETAYGSRIRERMKEYQKIILDRPLKPLDTAVWWTEYVLRHKDLSHLRPAGFEDYWFTRRLIDVWAFLFTIMLTSILLVVTIIKTLIKLYTRVLVQPNKRKTQ